MSIPALVPFRDWSASGAHIERARRRLNEWQRQIASPPDTSMR
ncbi:hypothetical protein R8871_03037 [Paraburkholderia graminis C4D1M]|uniref:Uncharacterized protein n=1 Tax=Paraburkholderia graminis (strain ATCC 700544 / DSM 17151 / LMG 18924 / NCIMB 13744 / C4D1M) TaxID=396598 RepID=B1FX36_PARG4|nr:hypothetical protein BgramDRAFT_1702 [Paraburkholderia graminis C4D1M]CAB3691070.1 hypothetical protein R8871_03037 [Paraburkholderia graminis C4D1M]